MNAVLPVEAVQCLDDICQQAFLMLAGMDATPAASHLLSTACTVACRISIHDAMGSQFDLLIQADAMFAHHFAQALFETSTPHVAEEEIIDAFKELANTVGGNLKGIIETETTLSIPETESCVSRNQASVSLARLEYCFANAGQCVVELCEPLNNS